ncbi:hypothetical protein ASPZODRAFT_135623 [Penicilliopsis zonata CBS 506.65]|uniref:Uncharacterized protein n=1 Tax=Penicilliopsis zonata CBS 506.65 TaxID=1073090 RepID=A0A1L9SAH4_9EURO|nr:hypothetical protein ASPZODRAFT_135623 [Penicilliopsis zonata CBS 506.65]OJJ44141.1 hypothetical protein ASPZODRAFT_135623 [Penicilliopsis zonata CBS 506.65]
MTRATTPPPLLLQLQSPESLSSQTAGLRALKNDIIGHDHRKEAWIGWGIVPVLSHVLASRLSGDKRFAELELNGAGAGATQQGLQRTGRTVEDEACVQAIIIVGSLAQGGPSFLSPILSSEIVSILLRILSSPDCPLSLSLPILRTLNAIADRLPLQSQTQWRKDTRLADLLFSREHIDSLARILAQDYTSPSAQASIELVAALVGNLCTEETHKATLSASGVLDALAGKVASFVVAQGFVVPGAEEHVDAPGALGALPAPAPPSAKLAPILRAISVIVEHSKGRAEHFLSSPGILTVFPKQLPPEFAPQDIKKAPWGLTYLSGSAVPRHGSGQNALDGLLPSVPVAQQTGKPSTSAANFPPLASTTSHHHHRRHSHSYPTPFSLLEDSSADDDEDVIVPWLLYIVRAETGMLRLMAARLLTVLHRLGFTKKHRVSMFSYLLIPILIRMLDKDYEMDGPEETDSCSGLLSATQQLKAEAPAVLATLVIDDQELQKHAVDGGAIKRLSQLLKESYNPIQENTRSIWHADASPTLAADALPQCTLGPPGYSPVVCHIMRYRENILKALAALVPFKDEYRKAVCENGVVPYIIDSLKPRPSDPPADTTTWKNTAADGNPTPTLLAACGAARMLTRSVSILRTSLIDAGVASPLFVLIKHPDIEVQIAATSVICNLVLDFSPMKEAIISADILPTLCEHAHSPDTKLRIESLWALKHVAYSSANDVKIKIIDALEPQWLKQIIMQDPTRAALFRRDEMESAGTAALGMGTANSAGEQVDLLNPMEDVQDAEDDFKMSDTMPSSKMSLEMFLPDVRRRRKLVMIGDLDQTTQARQDDIAVQEQTFDLLRNLICGTGAPEMIDYLFKTIGQDALLDALANKLRPRSIHLAHRPLASSSSRLLQVPPEILVSVTYVIIHLAASVPRHRKLLVAHDDLLRNLLGYFNHPQRDVRANCVWVMINLAHEDDQTDRPGCRDRSLRLKSLGVMDRLAALEDDADLDVRERTKTAIHLLNLHAAS